MICWTSNWFRTLSEAYDGFLSKVKQAGLTLPRQTRGAHRLDREVINYAIAVLKEKGYSIKSVRAALAEGAPFPNAALLNRSHMGTDKSAWLPINFPFSRRPECMGCGAKIAYFSGSRLLGNVTAIKLIA